MALLRETDADLLNLLDRLGAPASLTAEERERLGLRGADSPKIGPVEVGALVLTPLFWPIGVILLWSSRAWTVREKLIGTLVPPGGFFTSSIIFFIAVSAPSQACAGRVVNGRVVTTCSGPNGFEGVIAFILFVLILFSPIFTSIYLRMRLRQRSRSRSEVAPIWYLSSR